MLTRYGALLLIGFCVAGCDREAGEGETGAGYDPARDYFSFANTDQFESRHLALDLTVDFDRRVLHGHVIHQMACLDPAAASLVLDSRGLWVERIQLERLESLGAEAERMLERIKKLPRSQQKYMLTTFIKNYDGTDAATEAKRMLAEIGGR